MADKIKSGNITTPAKAVQFSSLAKIAAAGKGIDIIKTPTGNKVKAIPAAPNKPIDAAAEEEPTASQTSQPITSSASEAAPSFSLSAASPVFEPAAASSSAFLPAAAEDDIQIARRCQTFNELVSELSEPLPYSFEIYGGGDPTISAHSAETIRLYEEIASGALPKLEIIELEIKKLTKRKEARQLIHDRAMDRFFQAKERIILPAESAPESAPEAASRRGGHKGDDTADQRGYRATPLTLKISREIEQLTTDPKTIPGCTAAFDEYFLALRTHDKKWQDDALKKIYEILNQGLGAAPGSLGLTPIEDALSNHSEIFGETGETLAGVTLGGNSSQQVGHGAGRSPGIFGTQVVRCPQRSQSEIKSESDEAYRKLSAGDGQGLPKSTLGQTEDGLTARIITLPQFFSTTVAQRCKFQVRVIRGTIYLCDKIISDEPDSKVKDELLVLKSKLTDTLDKRDAYHEVPNGV